MIAPTRIQYQEMIQAVRYVARLSERILEIPTSVSAVRSQTNLAVETRMRVRHAMRYFAPARALAEKCAALAEEFIIE